MIRVRKERPANKGLHYVVHDSEEGHLGSNLNHKNKFLELQLLLPLLMKLLSQ